MLELLKSMEDAEKADYHRAQPSIWPVSRVTSDFGWRRHPIYGNNEFHSALDIAGSSWDPILATADGTIAFADTDPDIDILLLLTRYGMGLCTLTAFPLRSKESISCEEVVHMLDKAVRLPDHTCIMKSTKTG